MATSKKQRIGIWVIALTMLVGTLASFLVLFLLPKNEEIDSAKQQEQLAAFNAAYSEYQTKIEAQTAELSDKYYAEFSQYSTLPAAFDASSVTELKTEDLKIGDGEEINSDTAYGAYYIGWNPEGTIFDQSISDGSLLAPVSSETSFIEGWTEGVIGMKIGGVRLITIPSDKAYGEAGSGDDIPANTPIKFVIMAIPKTSEITQPNFYDYFDY